MNTAATHRYVRQRLGQWGAQAAKVMKERPVLTNSVLCFNLWVAGDLLAQSYDHKDNGAGESYNYMRTLRAASYGGLVSGPIYALWYPWLDRQCVAWNIAARLGGGCGNYSRWVEPIVKVAADEILMDPPTIALFFTYMEYCQNNFVLDVARTRQKIIDELPRAWVTSLVAWPAVLLATFRFVPIYAQPIVVNVCAIVWDGFLSHRNAVANVKQRLARQEEQEHHQHQQQQEGILAMQRRRSTRLVVPLRQPTNKETA